MVRPALPADGEDPTFGGAEPNEGCTAPAGSHPSSAADTICSGLRRCTARWPSATAWSTSPTRSPLRAFTSRSTRQLRHGQQAARPGRALGTVPGRRAVSLDDVHLGAAGSLRGPLDARRHAQPSHDEPGVRPLPAIEVDGLVKSFGALRAVPAREPVGLMVAVGGGFRRGGGRGCWTVRGRRRPGSGGRWPSARRWRWRRRRPQSAAAAGLGLRAGPGRWRAWRGHRPAGR